MKIILRINHFFTGHGLLIDYDEKYLYCGCGAKYEHYNSSGLRDWVFPYIETIKDKEYREKLRFGEWFFRWHKKRTDRLISKINLDTKDIEIL